VVANGVGGKGHGESLGDDGDGQRFDAFGRRVALGIRAELALEPEVNVVVEIKPRVFGPHTEERLCNSAYGVFHCARADRSAAGGNFTGAVAVGKNLKKCDGMVNFAELRVDTEVPTEGGPAVPTGNGKLGSASHDAVVNGLQDRAVITAEAKLAVG
jgi:hypothetical protein